MTERLTRGQTRMENSFSLTIIRNKPPDVLMIPAWHYFDEQDLRRIMVVKIDEFVQTGLVRTAKRGFQTANSSLRKTRGTAVLCGLRTLQEIVMVGDGCDEMVIASVLQADHIVRDHNTRQG